LFVVDAAKRLSFEVTEAVKRLSKVSIDAEELLIMRAV